jgi:hypothetical protein
MMKSFRGRRRLQKMKILLHGNVVSVLVPAENLRTKKRMAVTRT